MEVYKKDYGLASNKKCLPLTKIIIFITHIHVCVCMCTCMPVQITDTYIQPFSRDKLTLRMIMGTSVEN